LIFVIFTKSDSIGLATTMTADGQIPAGICPMRHPEGGNPRRICVIVANQEK